MRRFRQGRFSLFRDRLKPKRTDRILDVGGYPAFWLYHEPVAMSVDCLNIHPVSWDEKSHPDYGISTCVGDACDLPFSDGSYDILFSNSVIEHVSTWENQQDFAREARRVGKALWIQTPAYEGPLEPHYVGLYIHRLPKAWQRVLIPWLTLSGWVNRPTKETVESDVSSIRLLTRKEMNILFPDCEILTEHFLGILPKSYIAVRKALPAES